MDGSELNSTIEGARPRPIRRARSRSRPRNNRLRHRADRPADPLGRLPFRKALHVAEHDRHAVPLREPFDLFMEHFPDIVPARVILVSPRQTGRFTLVRPSLAGGQAGGHCDPMGDSVEPTGRGAPLADRVGSACQDQERGLERILGLMHVAKDDVADAAGPSRRAAQTSSANASSAASRSQPANRSSNCSSVRPPVVPTSNNVRMPRSAAPCRFLAMHLAPAHLPRSSSSVAGAAFLFEDRGDFGTEAGAG